MASSASISSSLILPASDYYVGALRAGRDPFRELVRVAAERDFATCSIVELEVCRGLHDLEVQRRFRQCLSAMTWQRLDRPVLERAGQLAWTLDRRSVVLPLPILIIAASALELGATLLSTDERFWAIDGLRVVPTLE